MSRWIEACEDQQGRYYVETMDNPDGCRWLINEVCCNADCDMIGDFPFGEDCTIRACGHFEHETSEDITRLREGVKTYG